MNNRIKRNMISVLEKDAPNGDTIIKAGTKIIQGTNCPRCNTFHAYALGVGACNYCGLRIRTAKPYELRRALKMQKRAEYINKEKELING